MALCELKCFSEVLGMQTTLCVILPEDRTQGEIGTGRAAGTGRTLYLLHGLSDDQSIWLRRTSVERYASAYGVTVVMPFAAKSYYTDMACGDRYYTYIAREVPEQTERFFGVSKKREDRFVAGLSMGGYGALKIGLREGGRFCAAAGLSPCVDLASRLDRPMMKPVFDGKVPPEDDLLALSAAHANDETKARLFIGVGTEDFLYHEIPPLRASLTANGYDLTYRESPGKHEWEFWDEYIRYVLEWMFQA